MAEYNNMGANEFLGYTLNRQDFLDAVPEMGPFPTSPVWNLLNIAAENQQSWAGVLQAAHYVITTKGINPKDMEDFFKSIHRGKHEEGWKHIASQLSEVMNVQPDSILDAVQKITEKVPIEIFRELINLDKITYCWTKYSDDPERLRQCLIEV